MCGQKDLNRKTEESSLNVFAYEHKTVKMRLQLFLVVLC